jgi:hypothetical protein
MVSRAKHCGIQPDLPWATQNLKRRERRGEIASRQDLHTL